jgi:hypothetical protein
VKVIEYALGVLRLDHDDNRCYADFDESIYVAGRKPVFTHAKHVPYFNHGKGQGDNVTDERDGAPVEWIGWQPDAGRPLDAIATPHWHREEA